MAAIVTGAACPRRFLAARTGDRVKRHPRLRRRMSPEARAAASSTPTSWSPANQVAFPVAISTPAPTTVPMMRGMVSMRRKRRGLFSPT